MGFDIKISINNSWSISFFFYTAKTTIIKFKIFSIMLVICQKLRTYLKYIFSNSAHCAQRREVAFSSKDYFFPIAQNNCSA